MSRSPVMIRALAARLGLAEAHRVPSRSSASRSALVATVQPKASKNGQAASNWHGGSTGHRLVALGVVGRVELGAVGGGVGAEAEDDGARLVQLDLAQDQVRGPEQRVDGLARRRPVIVFGSA